VGIGSDDLREWWFLDALEGAVSVWRKGFSCLASGSYRGGVLGSKTVDVWTGIEDQVGWTGLRPLKHERFSVRYVRPTLTLI
jgi:hypothetical protein